MFAGDAVKMAVELLEKGECGQVYNSGSEECIKIYDLADIIGEIMGYKIEVIHDEKRDRPWEIWRLQSDNTKLYKTISYRPQVGLKDAISKTIEYFNNNGKKWDF